MLKKVVAVILSLVIALSAALSVSAAGAESVVPLVLVSGMGYRALVKDRGTPSETNAWPPAVNAEELVLPAAALVFSVAAGGGWNAAGDSLIPAAYKILEPAACDENGDSKYNVTAKLYPRSAAHYPDLLQAQSSEGGFIHSACDIIGADNVYFFNYDWRLSPLVNAAYLNDYIQNVLNEKSCAKVDLAAFSMGGIVTLTYFERYGCEAVNSCLMLCSTYSGVMVAGEMMSNKISIDTQDLLRFPVQNYSTAGTKPLMTALLGILRLTGIAGALARFANEGIGALLDRVERELLKELLITMPGIWAVVRADAYEQAKERLLDPLKNAKLIERIDYVQYRVHRQRKQLIQNAIDSGVKIFFAANYNLAPAPVYQGPDPHSDSLIETVCASGGATCAPLGDTLPAGYIQQKPLDGKNYLSADGVIDASTCDFPDRTWFFKNVRHVDCPYGSQYNAFLLWLIEQDAQPTVFSDAAHPQFMGSADGGMTLSPVNAPEKSDLAAWLLRLLKFTSAA
ncbi:MAG TPA: hypothetical protein PL044_05610 [Clostridiales bacterium]|nr:MAG: hypothetical protein BWY37_01997 [Firmicutes bacterium ADurb.Bin262]HOU11059.1 hypothetical protein [Clostridiales bacterium]HQH63130.1 hypothetical protein [Clostridiales bacterium]HQK73234.1 hypothetical protein [Clostridiales bacterium]